MEREGKGERTLKHLNLSCQGLTKATWNCDPQRREETMSAQDRPTRGAREGDFEAEVTKLMKGPHGGCDPEGRWYHAASTARDTGHALCPQALPGPLGHSPRWTQWRARQVTRKKNTSNPTNRSRQQSIRNSLCDVSWRPWAAGGGPGRAGVGGLFEGLGILGGSRLLPQRVLGKRLGGLRGGPPATVERRGAQGRDKSLLVQNPLGVPQPFSVLWLSHETQVATELTALGRAGEEEGAPAVSAAGHGHVAALETGPLCPRPR